MSSRVRHDTSETTSHAAPPDVQRLLTLIADPGNSIRQHLEGELRRGLQSRPFGDRHPVLPQTVLIADERCRLYVERSSAGWNDPVPSTAQGATACTSPASLNALTE